MYFSFHSLRSSVWFRNNYYEMTYFQGLVLAEFCLICQFKLYIFDDYQSYELCIGIHLFSFYMFSFMFIVRVGSRKCLCYGGFRLP